MHQGISTQHFYGGGHRTSRGQPLLRASAQPVSRDDSHLTIASIAAEFKEDMVRRRW